MEQEKNREEHSSHGSPHASELHADNQAGSENRGQGSQHHSGHGSERETHGQDSHQNGQGSHVDHTGHEEMFRKRFWVSTLLSIPVLSLIHI